MSTAFYCSGCREGKRRGFARSINNPNYGQGVRGFPKDAGIDSIGLPKLIVKAASGEPPQWPSISRRCIAVSMTSAKCSKTAKRWVLRELGLVRGAGIVGHGAAA